jgi:hypothetical protein
MVSHVQGRPEDVQGKEVLRRLDQTNDNPGVPDEIDARLHLGKFMLGRLLVLVAAKFTTAQYGEITCSVPVMIGWKGSTQVHL